MDTACLDYVLTDSEKQDFDRDGYIVVPGALSAERVTHLAGLAERYHATHGKPGVNTNMHDLIGQDDAFLDLVDCGTTFPKVWGILGWNIQLFHTQLMITPPVAPGTPDRRWGWHQDNNRMNRDIYEVDLQPRVSLKVAYMLTDCERPGLGNFAVVPGSHTRRGLDYTADSLQPVGTVEVLGKAGDAVIFDRRLWHAGSQNRSERTRKMIFYGYSYRWLRTKSEMDPSKLLPLTDDPVRRQLLGASPNGAQGRYDPSAEDVPLREWIRSNCGAEAVVA
jgi:hypothetical protein